MPNAEENNDEPRFVVAQDGLAPPKADFNAPPPYELRNDAANLMNAQQQQPQQQINSTGHLIPANCKLPTYEEVQMEKSLNAQFLPAYVLHPSQMNAAPPPNPLLPNMHADGSYARDNVPDGLQPPRTLAFIAIDATGADTLTNNDCSLLGTDIMFITAFIVAFLFNWIGFLMLTCFCHTIAARYGALSGFGLSLAKWTMIVKHSTELASHKNSWLWWLIMAFGFLICIRALIQYVSIKRTWRLLSASAQERLLFFY